MKILNIDPVTLPPVDDVLVHLADDTVIGTAGSAGQITGAWNEDGRGPSIWDHYFHGEGQPGHGKSNGDVACDDYHRWPEDFEALHRAGLANRFSFSWSGVLPEGRGRVNHKWMDHYKRKAEWMRAHKMPCSATLYHWDAPLALCNPVKGTRGFLDRDFCGYFTDYASLMVANLGDMIDHWCTFNEPEVIKAGYTGTGLAPAFNDPSLGYNACHNLLVAHGMALQAMRARRPNNKYGIVLNLCPVSPIDQSDERVVAAAQRKWETDYAWYMDAVLKSQYPNSVRDLCDANGWELGDRPGDLSIIAQRLDWLGINYYTDFTVDGDGRNVEVVPKEEQTLMGWRINPAAFTKMLLELNRDYELPPVSITENGVALLDPPIVDGRIKDWHRIKYLTEHLIAIGKARAQGVNILGYFVWALLNNLEWSLGFAMTFGLIYVDPVTQERTPKDSFYWLMELVRRLRLRESARFGRP